MVTKWLKAKKVDVLVWPSQIPDVNLRENVWVDL